MNGGIIARLISSKEGRVMLASSITGSELNCSRCALRNSDCSKIRPTKPGSFCYVPEGTIYIFEERPA